MHEAAGALLVFAAARVIPVQNREKNVKKKHFFVML
jgi:hypothetical protein